jgi:hypothetical protein
MRRRRHDRVRSLSEKEPDDFETHYLAGCRANADKLLCVRERLWPEARWLGTGPTEVTQPPEPKKPARAKREISVSSLGAASGGRNNKVQPTDQWEQQQAADQDDEATQKRTLVNCRSCAVGETAGNDAASGNG